MLDDLFAQLRTATAQPEIEALQEGIWQIWLTTGDVVLDKDLEAGMRAIEAGDYTRAIEHFDRIIQINPALAEGWNKRATAHYLRGEYRAALADIAETLRREPRHFGALWGQAGILRQLGDYSRTLGTLSRLSGICAYLPGLREQQLRIQEMLDENSRPE